MSTYCTRASGPARNHRPPGRNQAPAAQAGTARRTGRRDPRRAVRAQARHGPAAHCAAASSSLYSRWSRWPGSSSTRRRPRPTSSGRSASGSRARSSSSTSSRCSSRTSTTTAPTSSGSATPCCTRCSAAAARPRWRRSPATGSPGSGSAARRRSSTSWSAPCSCRSRAITLPLYLVYAKAHLINSIWGMILPSLVSPVGVYLMRTYVELSVPRELIDAARIDGAGEARIFFRVALPLMVPGLMTVLLISVVTVWNNYFLPLIIFTENRLFPLTVGMGVWSQRRRAQRWQQQPLPDDRDGRPGHDRPDGRAVPDPAAVLAGRTAARQHRELRRSAEMPAVTLEKLTKVYATGVRAVDELDLRVDEGEFVVLVGPSGCGKTTALRMVAGLERDHLGHAAVSATAWSTRSRRGTATSPWSSRTTRSTRI